MTPTRVTRRAVLGSIAASAGCLGRLDRSSTGVCPPTVPGDVDARIGFAGDAMLGRGVDARWADGPPAGVWGSTIDRLDGLDGLVVNLECCLSERGERKPGRTYHFRADPDWAVPALAAGNVRVASLANNHVLDYGPAALSDTRERLSAAGIAHPGAGPDLDTALDPAVVDVGGLTLAVVGFTDRSPSYGAAAGRPGTAFVRMDPARARTRRLVTAALRRARERSPDLLVASLHWGPNWEVRPSRTQRRFAHWLVDRGVDVVHGHSAHVLQGIEVRAGRPIIYDAGDLVDDYLLKPGLHNDRSALFELELAAGRLDRLRVVPVEIVDERTTLAEGAAARWVRDRIADLSVAFGTTVVRDGDGLRVPLDAGC